MSIRHKAREFALQMLFQWDISPQEPAKLAERFWRGARAAPTTKQFAGRLFVGATTDATRLDQLIAEHSENWRLERLSAIDRAILRLGIHELRGGDTPPKVVLNEAVELAKKFSSEESAAFVNGILDAVCKSLKT